MLVVNDVVNAMFLPLPCTARLHNRLLCRLNIEHVINDEHNRIIIEFSAKHEIAPWWWFLREPKHVGAIVEILIVFNIPTILKLCVSFGIIKKYFDTIDARCKHEDLNYSFDSQPRNLGI